MVLTPLSPASSRETEEKGGDIKGFGILSGGLQGRVLEKSRVEGRRRKGQHWRWVFSMCLPPLLHPNDNNSNIFLQWFIENLLHAQQWPRHWKFPNDQHRHHSCPHGICHLGGKIEIQASSHIGWYAFANMMSAVKGSCKEQNTGDPSGPKGDFPEKR